MQDSKTDNSRIKYCCPAKQYYSKDACNLGNALKIIPRAIVYKKCLKVCNVYQSIVNVTNNGLYNRQLVYTTDSSDTSVQVCPTKLTNNFLLPDQSLEITVCIKPKSKFKINRRRHVFITSQHPNITFALPIIILTNDDHNDISLPSSLIFPPVTIENCSYYEMIVYNKSVKKLQFDIKSPLSNLTVHTKSFSILKRDYGKIMLKLCCKDYQAVDDSLKLKFSKGDNMIIPFQHEPLQTSLFVNTLNIEFDTLRFKRKETQEFSICNESSKDIVFHMDFILPKEMVDGDNQEASQTVTSDSKKSPNDSNDCETITSVDKFAYKHFLLEPSCGVIGVNSTYFVKVTFHPIMHKDFLTNDNDVPPFNVTAGVLISWENKTEQRNIYLKGQIIGPEIEILPEVLDLRQVYFGEEHCAQITVLNKDELCDAHVDLCDLSKWQIARIIATPKRGLTLKPYQNDVFRIQLYSTVMGKFLFKLIFKVRNGGKYSMSIKGYSNHVGVKCFPETINLYDIPIALPQKRFILLVNPLRVPLTVQCLVKDDGNETPLILNVQNVMEHLPITVKDPFYVITQSLNQENGLDNSQSEEEFDIQYSSNKSETSLLSVRSHIDEISSCSSEFEKLALDLIPDISRNLVSNLKTIKVFDKPEMEKIVIDEALNALLKTPYFFNMDKYKNYTQMDWNSLATDPKEIYCNTEIIHMKPNTTTPISVVIIPNVVGSHRKHIQLRVCPLMSSIEVATKENPDLFQIVESENMISKLWIEYNCLVPEIIWDNVIIMEDQLYAGEYYDFQMVFENNSDCGGFFYYDVIPHSNLGTMRFSNNIWKYFIKPFSKQTVPCQVKFTKLGSITLSGHIKFIGINASYPFHIKSEVLPPKIKICPRSICNNLQVLEFAKLYIFIENVTPTSTWFKLKLRDESSMSIEPHGAQLAPQGQAICVTLNIYFQDPGLYKNVLYVIMEFETIERIPIIINVKGIPIFFEPEIRANDLNTGYFLCNTEEEYFENNSNFSKVIKVINKGLRYYRVSLTRTKCSAKPSCSVNSSKSKLTIKPNNLIVPALSETTFEICISCCEATSYYSEFRLQLTDPNDVKCTESYRASLSATFIMPELAWYRRDIKMNYYRTHKYNEQEQWETIKLTNITQCNVDNVNLKITGPFKIKELFEHIYQHELNLSMKALETKEFFIMLNKKLIRNRLNIFYEGYITCTANLIVQKTVRLKVYVFVPKITLKHKEVILFTKNSEGGTYIQIANLGEIPAIYKWRKLKEEWHYISQEDDIQQVPSLILSDIIRMLELETINLELDSETNMTFRYQRYKCLLKNLDDPINVKEILYEIIDDLDLSCRRYKLSYQVPVLLPSCLVEETKLNRGTAVHLPFQMEEVLKIQENITESLYKTKDLLKSETIFINDKFQADSSELIATVGNSSNTDTCVFYTLDDILGHLKLENSYDVLSMPSSVTCNLRNTVYFFKKCGQLQEKQAEICALHIPAIRKGYEVRAIFELDVVGGKSQQLEVILVNLDKTVTINKQHIYLGLKPWYEQYRTKTYVENTTKYHLSVKVRQTQQKIEHNLDKIALGFNNILGNKMFQLSPYQIALLRTEGIMGFNENFKRELNIVINEHEELTLQINGHGTMPMLLISKPILPLVEQHSYETIEEYYLLQKIYYFEIFKTMTEKDEDYLNAVQEEAESHKAQSYTTDSFESEYETIRPSVDITRQMQFLNLMRSYVLVNNNEDIPNSAILEQLLQTEKFLILLHFNSETRSLLGTLYQNYLLHLKMYDQKMPINLKQFTIQSIPFHLKTNILNMGKLYLNQYCKFIITLEFIGPGKLIAAARTAIKIPGLVTDFKILDNDENNDFIYYRAEDKLTTCDDKAYRNINERLFDKETDPKIKHAHSYDINPFYKHERVITMKDSKCLRNYYNSLTKSIYMEQKYHFTHCKIAVNRKITFPRTKISIIILFRPQKSYYKHKQIVEDYLYIDLHMGPTLPILLRGVIVDRKMMNNT